MESSEAFAAPEWLGQEVTGDERYANRTLALRGAPDPSAAEEAAPREVLALDDAALRRRAYAVAAGSRASRERIRPAEGPVACCRAHTSLPVRA